MSDFNSSLPVRTEAAGDVIVKVGDGTTPSQQLAIDSSGKVHSKVNDGAGNLITSHLSGGVRALDVSMQDSSGAAISPSNPLPVYQVSDIPGTEVNSYQTNAAIAAAGTSNHDYTVTALKTLSLKSVQATASGKAKIEVQIETGVASGVFTTNAVAFNSTANPNMLINFVAPPQVAAGVRVRVIRTNKDNQAQDLYSTIMGQEI